MTRRRLPMLRLGLVLLVVAAGVAGIALVRDRVGCTFAASGSCLRVLFIGNSYTSFNDLPGQFASLVRSSGQAVEVGSVTPGGATLVDHAGSSEVAAAIAGSSWTAVVLQEQSELPAASEQLDTGMAPAAASLVHAVRADGARPYLFQTWAHRDGWPERRLDRPAMQAAIDASYDEVSARVGAPVARVGDAWARASVALPALALWQADGSHPTAAGTYLAACVLYASVTGRSPVGLPGIDGLAPADAAVLQAIAAAR